MSKDSPVVTVRVIRWGNGLGFRLPTGVARRAGIDEGSELKISFSSGRIVLVCLSVPSLKDLLGQAKTENRRDVVDWGKPIGLAI